MEKALDAKLLKHCRSVLKRCDEFKSNEALHAVFIITEELKPFADKLPQVNNISDRLDQTIAYLLDKKLNDGRFVFPRFLRALGDKYDLQDDISSELATLAQKIQNSLSHLTSPYSPDSSPRKIYKLFIASPCDVLQEREIIYTVVEKINQTIENNGKNYRLEVYDWKHSVYPDYGPPQEVISKQVPIEECDIVIGVFWTRFGSPPGSKRPQDGRPYLSGTEKEIDEAIAVRKRSPSDLPIIMLYRKTDPIPTGLKEEDYLQYAKVIEYFRQCDPDGEHPALVVQFQSDEFEITLEKQLRQAVQHLEQPSHVSEVPERTKPQVEPLQQDQHDPLTNWLNEVGLDSNPFDTPLAQKESNLLKYFVETKSLRVRSLMDVSKTWVIFAKAGCGKTALRINLASRCFPQDKNSELLCVVLGATELGITLERAKKIENLTSLHYLQTITQLVLKSLKPSNKPPWKDLYVFAELEGSNLDRNPSRWLDRLASGVKQEGFPYLLCLVDQVDEIPDVDGDLTRMARMLKPLMAISIREAKGFAFRYLLPKSLRSILLKQQDIFRLDRCQVDCLEWEPQDLQKILNQRMIFFSADKYSPYKSLGQLCAGELSTTVDPMIATLAEGNPRAALWLANQLIKLHGQTETPTRLIQPSTWEQMQFEWWTHGRSQIFGKPDEDEGFYTTSDRIYFQNREIKLSDRYHRLLHCIVSANGEVCTMDALAKAGWLDEDPTGVSVKAIREAIRRMKQELQRREIDPRWIKTVRGRGYCLSNPLNTAQQETK